jgi:hypothetical protein
VTGTKRAGYIAILFAFALTAQKANASLLGAAADARKHSAAQSLIVHKIHGCHYSCACGPPQELSCEKWNHRHLHMLCLPVRCERDADCERALPERSCRPAGP